MLHAAKSTVELPAEKHEGPCGRGAEGIFSADLVRILQACFAGVAVRSGLENGFQQCFVERRTSVRYPTEPGRIYRALSLKHRFLPDSTDDSNSIVVRGPGDKPLSLPLSSTSRRQVRRRGPLPQAMNRGLDVSIINIQ